MRAGPSRSSRSAGKAPVRSGTGDSQQGRNQRDVGRDAETVSNIISLVQAPDVQEEVKGDIKTWIAQANTAVFVGAIQAQLLDTNVQDGFGSRLHLTRNILFLTGIILHVTGAYFALMAASELETDLNHLNAELKYLSASKLREEVFNGLTTLAKRFVKPHYYDEEGASSRKQGNRTPDYSHLAVERLCRSVRRHQFSGKFGSYSIALGFLACLAGLGCLSYEYDRKAMRIAASVVIFILLFVRFVILFIHKKISDIRS